MKFSVLAFSLVILAAASRFAVDTHARSQRPELEAARAHFKGGRFKEAKELCRAVLAKDPNNFQALLLEGHVALLESNLTDAQKSLSRATRLKPDEKEPKELLAEAYYRRDDFQKAAALYRAVGREAEARKLESFKSTPPYQIEGTASLSRVKLVITDPLPLISVRVNGGDEVTFLIDTGGSEVSILSELASRLAIERFGTTSGTFGGGQQAAIEHGRIDSLALGEFVVKNIPVNILNAQLAIGGKRISGILGHCAALSLHRDTRLSRRRTHTAAEFERQPQ
jgi:hypothetical protein